MITVNPAEAAANGSHSLPDSTSAIREVVERIVEKANSRVSSSEQIKRFAILDRDFSPEFDEVIPTMKLKRSAVAKNFAPLIEELYRGM